MENYLKSEYARSRAQKRGGGCVLISLDAGAAENGYVIEPADNVSPEILFDRRWAVTLLNRVMSRLRDEFSAVGSIDLFDALEPRLWRNGSESYADLGSMLGMSEEALRQRVTRMRKRFREILREEIAQTVESPDEVAGELEYLRRVLAG